MPEVADCYYCKALVSDDSMVTLRVPGAVTVIKPTEQQGFANITFVIVRAHQLCHGMVKVIDRIPEENLQKAL